MGEPREPKRLLPPPGDGPAINRVVAAIRARAMDLGRKLGMPFDAADEVAQRLSIGAAANPAVGAAYLDDPARLGGAVSKALWNEVAADARVDRRRSRILKERGREMEGYQPGYMDPEQRLAEKELALISGELIELLPEMQRLAIRMVMDEGLTKAEIGARLGVTAESAKSYVNRARQSLRDQLKALGYNVPAPQNLGKPRELRLVSGDKGGSRT